MSRNSGRSVLPLALNMHTFDYLYYPIRNGATQMSIKRAQRHAGVKMCSHGDTDFAPRQVPGSADRARGQYRGLSR